MCRFLAYLGPPITISSLVTEPQHSLIHQSHHSEQRSEPLNGDGFGVAWYQPAISPQPAVFRSISPAWSNQNLLQLARVTSSGCVFAHVRAATPGMPVVETNCHPFAHGPWTFMHNGSVAGFHAARREFLSQLSDDAFRAIMGSTDSEHVFALFQDCLRAAADDASAEALAVALDLTIQQTVSRTAEHAQGQASRLNLAVSDGRRAVVTRYSSSGSDAESLYFHEGQQYRCDDGVCRMLRADGSSGAVIVSSEPLSSDDGWQEVPVNHAVLVDAGRVTVRPCDVSV